MQRLSGDGTARWHVQMTIVIAFIAAVFVLDVLAPSGIPFWLLYGLPFLFIRYGPTRDLAYALAVTCTVLILVGYAFAREGSAEPLTHRASAVMMLWMVTIALARHRPKARST